MCAPALSRNTASRARIRLPQLRPERFCLNLFCGMRTLPLLRIVRPEPYIPHPKLGENIKARFLV